jgi:hypothetical protein
VAAFEGGEKPRDPTETASSIDELTSCSSSSSETELSSSEGELYWQTTKDLKDFAHLSLDRTTAAKSREAGRVVSLQSYCH